MNTFSYRIRDLRRERNISGEELGKTLGVGKTTVSAWENGVSHPNNDVMLKLADYFNVSLDYLMGRTDEPRTQKPITENDFLVAFSNIEGELTEEQKKQMLDIANAYAMSNEAKKGK